MTEHSNNAAQTKPAAGKLSKFLPFVGFIVLAFFLYFGLFSDPRQRASELEGKSFPEFSLPDLNNADQLYTRSAIIGKPLLLNVWGTWCVTCRYELPFLTKLRNDFGVQVVGLYYEQNHDPEFGEFADVNQIQKDVANMVNRLGDPYQFNILDLDRELLLDLGVTGAPETFVIDAQGVILMHHLGEVDERVWREKIAPIWNQL